MDRSVKGELKVSVWLPRALWRRAKLQAVEEDRPLRLLICDALSAYLNPRREER